MEEAVERDGGDPGLVAQWDRVHRGDVHNYVKMTFAKGAFVKDPSGLFNSSLEGNLRRAIDFREDDKINEKALKALIRSAVAVNESSARG